MNRAARLAVSGAVATTAGRTARGVLDAVAGSSSWWHRTNHDGRTVSLLEGPSLVAAVTAGAVAGAPDLRSAFSVTCAVAGAGTFGMVDDLFESTEERSRGLRGHLGALRRGKVTTGAVKIAGIGACALVAAATLPRAGAGARGRTGAGGGLARTLLDIGVDAALIAGTANLVNLFDLRPGRALKASAALVLPLAGSRAAGTAGAVLGAVVAAAPADLDAHDMAGDGGANALGAGAGHAVAASSPLPVRLVALAGVVGLTLASEKVSFSAVIERTPWLRAVDRWGRGVVPAQDRSAEQGPEQSAVRSASDAAGTAGGGGAV